VVTGEGKDRKALFTTADGAALGFALSGAMVAERQVLAKGMPALLE
jgi:rubredoxin---NAD+ reductase